MFSTCVLSALQSPPSCLAKPGESPQSPPSPTTSIRTSQPTNQPTKRGKQAWSPAHVPPQVSPLLPSTPSEFSPSQMPASPPPSQRTVPTTACPHPAVPELAEPVRKAPAAEPQGSRPPSRRATAMLMPSFPFGNNQPRVGHFDDPTTDFPEGRDAGCKTTNGTRMPHGVKNFPAPHKSAAVLGFCLGWFPNMW
ncbi:uncharacterized protein LOC109276658 [Panthera pardus]|uniref:Uncharacterized protein LOC109276658 n=1 Tax=Panthera pardus TaxID=9691 RepID=A0A9V1GFG8_PANPR|nr:uncharacterized protein LOC109276658 [Panthera pardus]